MYASRYCMLLGIEFGGRKHDADVLVLLGFIVQVIFVQYTRTRYQHRWLHELRPLIGLCLFLLFFFFAGEWIALAHQLHVIYDVIFYSSLAGYIFYTDRYERNWGCLQNTILML
jgi:hypothetical protein